jgi:hypothetical protein
MSWSLTVEVQMRQRFLASAGIVAVLVIGAISVSGQTPARSSSSAAASKWTPPRTPDGKPDMQGIWDFRTVTPMERPAEFANKAVLTPAEAAAYEKRIVASRNADTNRDKETSRGIINGTPATADVALAYNEFWWDRGTKVAGNMRTSLVIDPPDGKIPPLTPAAEKRLEEMDKRRERPAEGPEDRSVGERCMMGFNAGPPWAPGGYNMNVQVVQAPGYVVLMNEMVHSARVVPLDGRPFGNVRQWSGVSRGRWEGDTLVIETKNFSTETSLRGSSPNLHLIERLTLTDPETLVYEFTVSDPTTWTKPWTAQIPMRKSQEQIFEYACHEGNYGMSGLLRGARTVEKDQATSTRP